MSDDRLKEAVEYLTQQGWGVVSPEGTWWNANIAKGDEGIKMVTSRSPIFGMVNRHGIGRAPAMEGAKAPDDPNPHAH